MEHTVRLSAKPRRNWSDWAGFVFFLCFTVFLVIRAQRIALLMLPTIAHELLTAASFLLRSAPRARLGGVAPRLTAYAATFIVPAFILVASAYAPNWFHLSQSRALLSIGLFLWLLGVPLVLLGVWQLRRSFSIEPQARQFVTGGPYLLARHPIYTGYLLQYLGILLAHFNPIFAAVFVTWLMLALVRTRYEETVLIAAFPEYAMYKKRVGMFGPKLRTRAAITRSVPIRSCTRQASTEETQP